LRVVLLSYPNRYLFNSCLRMLCAG
jgi:hypothetical protein